MKASLSLDLDNKWSYMKTHGDPGWESYPSYLDTLIPRVLSLLDELHFNITFFIVGRDAEVGAYHDMLRSLAARGHEIGNHSFFHEPWICKRTESEIDDELARAEDAIGCATGELPRGFRGPGFASSDEMTKVLCSRGYLYDASSLPTFIGPLARAYYLRATKMSDDDLKDRDLLFGRFSDGFRKNAPYFVRANGSTLLEIPVTTMPILRIPIHLSYVLYLAEVSPALALAYVRTALAMCRITGTPPSILLHPLDFLSVRECPELAFFPAMSLDAGVKADVVSKSLLMLKRQFEIVPLREMARSMYDGRVPEPHPQAAAGSRT